MKKGAGGSLAIVVPPDGGWGWVVVFAAFYCNLVVDGIIYSFGMLMNDMVNTFHETESKITIVGSLLNGFYLIAGNIFRLSNRISNYAVYRGWTIFSIYVQNAKMKPKVYYLQNCNLTISQILTFRK